MGVALDLGVQTSEVEPVEDVIFFYFAEVFVPLGRQEPGNPLNQSKT